MPALAFSASPQSYCRQARRLRARLGNDPYRLQFALRELSNQTNARTPESHPERLGRPADLLNARVRFEPDQARLFSSRVAAALTGGVLRYSDRQDLLREAGRMGISRFEATLLIAAVQHRAGNDSPKKSYTLSARPRLFPYALVLAAVAVQTAIASTVWWVVHP